MGEKVGKSRFALFFQWFVGGWKSRLDKVANAQWFDQMRDEKLHAVAWSTFPSQNVQSTPCSDQFWKMRCRKKCTLLLRETHFPVKSVKDWQFRSTFEGWDDQHFWYSQSQFFYFFAHLHFLSPESFFFWSFLSILSELWLLNLSLACAGVNAYIEVYVRVYAQVYGHVQCVCMYSFRGLRLGWMLLSLEKLLWSCHTALPWRWATIDFLTMLSQCEPLQPESSASCGEFSVAFVLSLSN